MSTQEEALAVLRRAMGNERVLGASLLRRVR